MKLRLYPIQSQFDGCVQGYTDHNAGQKLDLFAFRMLNGVGDLLDLINAVDQEKRPNFDKMSKKDVENYVAKNGHCSGFIKLTGLFLLRILFLNQNNLKKKRRF